jgi:hypothetical protein
LALFASRVKEKKKVVRRIRQRQELTDPSYQGLVSGLNYIWFGKEDAMETVDITPEKVMEFGALLGKNYLKTIPTEVRLEGLSPKDRIKGLSPEEVVQLFSPEEVLRQFSPEEVLRQFSPEEIEKALRNQARKKGNS